MYDGTFPSDKELEEIWGKKYFDKDLHDISLAKWHVPNSESPWSSEEEDVERALSQANESEEKATKNLESIDF